MTKLVKEASKEECASFAASDAAMISASQDDSATLACFFDPHEITA